jgi:hypothetical protein
MSGYANSEYAESLAEFGTPRALPRCEGWILERTTPSLPYRDAIGCYPLFSCRDWSKLREDIDNLGDDLVSLSMVPDPFGEYDEAYLRECFRDVVIPFKQHFIVDMCRPINEIVSRHHRKYALKALKHIRTDACPKPEKFLEEWIALHQNLVKKHDIKGLKAFSRNAFAKQLRIPGIVVLRAKYEAETVGAQLWFVQKGVAYGHVLAFNELGYKLGATYALYWFAINYFSDKVRWCNLAGVAGVQENSNDGLNRFKEGWSTGKQTAYFCGRILHRERYAELVQARNVSSSGFFPAYGCGF